MATIGLVGHGRLGVAVERALTTASHVVHVVADSAGERPHPPLAAVVDASRPAAFEGIVERCSRAGVGLVYCVSEVSDEALDRLDALARRVPVVLAPNLSRLHWLQLQALAALRDQIGDADVSVADRHPTTKAPQASRTATLLAAALGIGGPVAVTRSGPPVSDHTVTVQTRHESLTITHAVRSLDAVEDGVRLAVDHVLRSEPGMTTIAALFDRTREGHHGEHPDDHAR